ncbi:pentapeptide repeat-containing protein [Streptomyces sp. NPDC049555]|uniref:pentapeptide repeat-containing protein n=1 Tax=Streptomyces sp. NPDC049555 TaxID=3154930 RepID=UPI00342B71DD
MDLPSLDTPEYGLVAVGSLANEHARLSEFTYANADLRELALSEGQLVAGRITAVRSQRAFFENLRLHSVEFSGCDLGDLRWHGGKISRVRFSSCKLLGAALDELVLEHVLFENCKLDYATLERIRCAGPVIFSRCSLGEARFAGCDLTGACFDACGMKLTEFDGGSYRDCDLRGNDLSHIRGIPSLRQIVIGRAQALQLAEALAAELDVTYGDDTRDE